jgi:hypothetical protein
MGSPATADAARVKPPGTGNNNEAALAAATASAALDLFAGQGADARAIWATLVCTAPFNFLVGEAAVAAPTSTGFFAAETTQAFRAIRSTLGYLRVIMPAGGSYKWWVSGP